MKTIQAAESADTPIAFGMVVHRTSSSRLATAEMAMRLRGAADAHDDSGDHQRQQRSDAGALVEGRHGRSGEAQRAPRYASRSTLTSVAISSRRFFTTSPMLTIPTSLPSATTGT